MCESSLGDLCYLVLEDGSVFPGTSFGVKKTIDGEVGKFTLDSTSCGK